MSQLPQPADRFHPAEDLLNQLAFLLADGIPGMTRGAAIDRRADGFLRHMRRDRKRPYRGDEGGDIEILVPTHGAPGRRTRASPRDRRPCARAWLRDPSWIDGCRSFAIPHGNSPSDYRDRRAVVAALRPCVGSS